MTTRAIVIFEDPIGVKSCRDCNELLTEDNHRDMDGRRCTLCFRKHARDRKRERYHTDPEYQAYFIGLARSQRADPVRREELKEARERPEAVVRRRQRRNERYRTEPKFRMLYVLRGRIQVALREGGARKAASTQNLLGISREQFLHWIEHQFKPGMTWDNHGEVWHIDHVRPCASFDLTDEAQQRACFSWSNQQPLLKEDNWEKHDAILPELIAKHDKIMAEYAATHSLEI
jgi:hypothetical protein